MAAAAARPDVLPTVGRDFTASPESLSPSIMDKELPVVSLASSVAEPGSLRERDNESETCCCVCM